jgi:hypothetical protein
MADVADRKNIIRGSTPLGTKKRKGFQIGLPKLVPTACSSQAAELATEQQRSAGHRADFERERERADQLVTSQDKLVIPLKNLRLLLQVARQDAEPVAQRTLREWVALVAHDWPMRFLKSQRLRLEADRQSHTIRMGSTGASVLKVLPEAQ